MVRQFVSPRMTFAAPPALGDGGAPRVRRFVTARCPALARMLLAPLVLAVAAIAGVLFLILLPVCGIATIAEAVTKDGWAFVRGALTRSREHRARRV